VALWRLRPIDPSDPSWQASSHRGAVLVRAPSEEAARRVAAQAFGVKFRFPPNHGPIFPPWTRPQLTRAERVRDDRFEPNGPTELLEPAA
jgi:hypothetical protein